MQMSSVRNPIEMSELSNVLIIDDHPLFRDALRSAVSLAYPAAKSAEVSTLDDAVSVLGSESDYDIALLDLNLPGVQGFEGLLQLRTLYPRLPVLVVSGLEDEQIIDESLTFGAAGFLPKSLGGEVLAEAIETILEGNVYVPDGMQNSPNIDSSSADKAIIIERLLTLTPQQLRVLFMLKQGLLNKQIAYELDVGATTVKKHVSEILRKLRVHSRTQAVIEVSKLDQDELFDMQRRFNQ